MRAIKGTSFKFKKVMSKSIKKQDRIVKFVTQTGLCFECKTEKIQEKGDIRCPKCHEKDQKMILRMREAGVTILEIT